MRGTFSAVSKRLGAIDRNTRYGVFGEMYAPLTSALYPEGVALAYPDEVETAKPRS